MAMTLRLSESDDRLLTDRARTENRSKQEIAREAIRAYLNDQDRRIEDLEDDLAVARYSLRRELGEVTYTRHAEARRTLGLDRPAHG
ncbi:ribbon-helix-helix CopG family protein [Nocardioides albertanoniae]|uniref:Ribbon-helix-helix CopG family protein n=1 Tax=Nocardioides albertanoniae TaxID=1175486 RepID=A0A543A1L1_9ACTN|nr:ribbon-helix-helix protein, CopG family [Nocardioides albertanoniae]TQL66468.1 ribbon-helix-helix CopG family protein [Nocardioides albertanoniae]